ncbi:unnamed protein product [Durusdinium trenchii]|uniref:Glutathione synthetase n=1 Tax=Durusdinium trenchii TaxID=1381693 RepID=A0ABP0IQN8_9DINO
MARGIVMYPTPSNKREAAVVPMTLLPCPFADNYFQLAKKLTPDFHLLMDKITCDIGWLERALAKTGAIDEICSKLLEICRSVYNAETGKDRFFKAYSSRWEPLGLPRVVLFIVLEEEKNEKLELAAFQQGICSLRRSLAQLSRTCELRPLVARKQVTVAYFRSGYWPQHFEGAWLCRQQLERSEAAKCPSAPAQLAGMKKVQQLLCDSAELSRFLSEEQAAAVSSTFAKQFDPSNTSVETREAVQAARKSPGDWVLKPQVEGSGELYFDDDIPRVLESRSEDQLAEFILMERVRPPCTPSAILHDGAVLVRRAVAELGIFGTFVADGDKVRCNKVVGHLLRSKGQQTNQGGVFVGNATVDVPFLVPSDIYWRNVTA